MPALAMNVGANRVVRGVRIEHVCGDPSLAADDDARLMGRIVGTALTALRTPVQGPTLFDPWSAPPALATSPAELASVPA
jgi:hypothetical protein